MYLRSLVHLTAFYEAYFLCICLFDRTTTAICPGRCACRRDTRTVNCAGRVGDGALPLDVPSYARVLFLGSNFISSVTEEHFQDMGELRELYLNGNSIMNIPSFAFRPLEKLEILDLQQNRILQVDRSSFEGLVSMVHLDLSENKITSIDQGTFSRMRRLERLDLSGNNLRGNSLPIGLFEAPIGLTWFDIGHAELQTVPNDLFDHLTNLTFLNMSGNRGIQLNKPSLFAKLQHLNTLILEDCELDNLAPGLFQGLVNLVELRLNSNSLQGSLPLESFYGTVRLQKLQLNNNHIVYFHEMLLDVPSLQHLQLMNNPWECDCGLLGVRVRWPDFPPRFLQRGLTCHSPGALRGRNLWGIQPRSIYNSCVAHVPALTTVTLSDSVKWLECPIFTPDAFKVAWFTPNAEYITQTNNNSTVQILHDGILQSDNFQLGTYICYVVYAKGDYKMAGVVVVEIVTTEFNTGSPGGDEHLPPVEDAAGWRTKHAVLVFAVLSALIGVVLSVWAVLRLCRRRNLIDHPREPSLINDKHQGDDSMGSPVYDYAYSHARAPANPKEDSAYAVGPLWDGWNTIPCMKPDTAAASRLPPVPPNRRMRPISRSVQERGPRYYNVRSLTTKRRSSLTTSGDVVDYVDLGHLNSPQHQIPSLSTRIRGFKRQLLSQGATNMNSANTASPTKCSSSETMKQRPESVNNRYLEIL